MSRDWKLAAALAFGLLVLGGCANAPDASAPSSGLPASTPTASGSQCDPKAISTVVADFYSASAASQATGLSLQSVSSVECAGDWGIAHVVVGDGQGHDVSDFEVTHQVDGGWVVADRMVVCGTWNPKKPAQMPADAQIDPRLYAAACAAG